MNGPAAYYYENGKLSSQGNYHDCKEEGEWIFYHSEGGIERQGNFKNAKESGWWTYFDIYGVKIKEVEFVDGQPINEVEF